MKATRFNTLKFFITALLLTVITAACSKEDNSANPDTSGVDGTNWNGTYYYSTTNFDDGWTSVVKDDWVEVTKDNMKVLIHFPQEATASASNGQTYINTAWNALVAPRYSNIQDYTVAENILSAFSAYFASATLTDNATGKQVYVGLFQKGSGEWMEFVFPSKTDFVNYFGVDINTITWTSDIAIYDPMARMAGYNKFAVAATDLPGKWSNDFASNAYYVNIYTGWSAGMTTYSSNETYVFGSSKYDWSLVAATTTGGSTSVNQAKSSGTYSLPNYWQLSCSNISDKPKTYNVYFSCVKGARILWMQDAEYPTSYISYGRIE